MVLFDLDGTLVNTTPLILESFSHTWQHHFGFVLDHASYVRTFGIPLEYAMPLLFREMAAAGQIATVTDEAGLSAHVIATYREFNLTWHDEMICPFEGIESTLQALSAAGFRLGVVTSKKRAGAERGLKFFNLNDYFDVRICAEDTDRHKPDPEPLIRAMQQISARPEESIYVGDSIHDLVAGRAAGVSTAAAGWGPFERATLEQYKPDFFAKVPPDLLTCCGL